MNCPVDGSPLATRTYEADVQVEQCDECHGYWLDPGELERIQEALEHDYRDELSRIPDTILRAYQMAQERARRPLTCPRCHTNLSRREYAYCSQILIDVCPSCRGIWLDRGELAELAVFFERSKASTEDLRKGFMDSLPQLPGGGAGK